MNAIGAQVVNDPGKNILDRSIIPSSDGERSLVVIVVVGTNRETVNGDTEG